MSISEDRKRSIIDDCHKCLDKIERCIKEISDSANHGELIDNFEVVNFDAEMKLLMNLIDARAELANIKRDNKKLTDENRKLYIENAGLRKQVDELRSGGVIRLPSDWTRIT